ncbi:hypothetical protein H5410_032357 [Solanum commersonii]|uniref:Uncharacterized protein n=1 Tax=Solanum commersonii TaxID=4109 RepID=A0A9J5YJR2_SOLCO|nr:hypothetical protein H5410_032357 [Solanum commersonii]
MTSPSENHNLAIIPYEYQESPFILPDVMLIDSFGVTHLAYPLMEDVSIQEEQRYQSLVYTTYSDDDDTLLVKLIPKQLHRAFGKCPPSEPSVAIPVQVTRAVQRDLDVVLLTKSTKKSHGKKSKFIPPKNPIDVLDDVIVTKKDRKRKRIASIGHSKKQVMLSKSVQTSSHTDDSDGYIVVNVETRKARILAFKKRTVIRGRVVTGIGGNEMGELRIVLQVQGWSALFLKGNRRRKMGRKETREFYINTIGSDSSITSKVGGISFTLIAEVLSKILGVPNITEAYIHRICVYDDKDHGLGYGFWLGEVFEYFHISIKDCHEQTTKDVLGKVDHIVIPATYRGDNAPMQRLKALLTTKNVEIDALKVSHSAAMDQLHISYGLEYAGLVEENSRLKEELAKTQAALETERTSNLVHLKNLVDMFAKGSLSSSSCVLPFV